MNEVRVMIHYAPLERLPSEVEIPERFKARFWYDDRRECLAFDGPMWKSTFDCLRGLSRDLQYRRAIEELFRAAVPEERPPRRLGRWPAILVAAVLVVLTVGGVLWQVTSQLLAGK